MKPVLYRYKDTESVVLAMDGYVPVDGWSPLFDEAAMKAATAAALERAADVCEELSIAEECATAIRALKDES